MPESNDGYFAELTGAIGRGWNRFWFEPADPRPCAVLRIAVGLLAIAHLLTMGIDLEMWYGRAGLLPPETVTALLGGNQTPNYHFSYLNYLTQPGELWIAHAAALAVAAAFTLGLLTRASGLLTAAAVLAYVHRAPMIAGHVEPVLVFLLLYLCVGPSGSALSLDAWIFKRGKADAADEPSMWANLSLRMIQVHVALFYLMMGLTKLYGDAWWGGFAIWHLAAQTQSRPLDLSFLRASEYTINFWTHAIVYFELAFPVLIWNRLARPLLVALSVLIWISLILATGLVTFGLTMIVANAAFLPAEWYRGRARAAGTQLSPRPA
jgi:hypothetical protein